MRNLEANSRHNLSQIKVVYREGADAAAESIGGEDASNVFSKARTVERAIYEVSAALIAPPENAIREEATAPYHPFDAIDYIVVKEDSGQEKRLKPLVILDDAHTLHPSQLATLGVWLARREMKIARWLFMRLDAETPEEVLSEVLGKDPGALEPEIKKSREITYIWLQGNSDRKKRREDFRKMAKSMADKYLRLMPVFNRQGISHFNNILSTETKPMHPSKLGDLRKRVEKVQRRIGISDSRRTKLELEIAEYFKGSPTRDNGDDVQLALLHILMHRYAKRVPQESLFHGLIDDHDLEPSIPLKVKASLVDGAKIFLLHHYNRPYFCGIDTLCDASTENAELFLQLAGSLVDAAETRIIRTPNNQPALDLSFQQKVLREKAEEID